MVADFLRVYYDEQDGMPQLRFGFGCSSGGEIALPGLTCGEESPRIVYLGKPSRPRALSVAWAILFFVSIVQRLYPAEEAGLLSHAHMRRFLWNLGNEQRGLYAKAKHQRAGSSFKPPANVAMAYGPRPSLFADPVRAAAWVEPVWNAPGVSYEKQAADLTELRAWAVSDSAVREVWGWIAGGSVEVQQKTLRSLQQAWVNKFGGSHDFPNFKKRSSRDGGFQFKNPKVRRCGASKKWCEVQVPKVGWVKFRLTGSYTEVASSKTAHVRLQNTVWTISFQAGPPPKILGPAQSSETGDIFTTGVDRGVTNTLALVDGRMFQIPSLTEAERARFLSLQRRLSSQRKGSNRRTRTLDQTARLRQRLLNRRKNWIEQTTTTLAREYDGLVLERLNTKGLVKSPAPKPDTDNEGAFLPNMAAAKAALSRMIHASCWDMFATRLEAKTFVVYVNPAYTSQQCFKCDHVAAENRENQAVFVCVDCGHTEHADINAARNIHRRGYAALVSLIAANVAENPGTPEARTPIAVKRQRVSTNSRAA